RDVAWAALVVATAYVAAWRWLRDSGEPPRGSSRLGLQLPGHQAGIAVQALALSPDGRAVVYVGAGGAGPLYFVRRLYVRRLDAPAARALAGTEGAYAPAVSPDGRWVAFLAEGRLKKVPLDGGAPVVLADVPDFGIVPTLSWGGDVIVFEGRGSALYRVPAEGGRPEPFLTSDSAGAGIAYTAPEWLPGGRAGLVTVWRDSGARGVAAVPLDSRGAAGGARLLVRDAVSPRYVAGHLLYATLDGAVFRAPFDPTALRLTGPPAPVLAGVTINWRSAQLAVSETGTLVYLPDSLGANGLAVLARDGAVRPLPLPGAPRQRYVFGPRFSPDGRRVAVPLSTGGATNVASTAIWVLDVEDSTFTRVGGGPGPPEWMPDGRRLSYPARAPERGRYRFYAIRPDGGEREPLPTPALAGQPQLHSWGPDGRWLVVSEGRGSSVYSGGQFDLRRVDLPDGRDGGGGARPVVATPADERAPAVSPDGRWLAYVSFETGRYEVYVRALDAAGGRWQVSAGGGLEPRWARDGAELFYRTGDELVAARVRTAPTFAVAARTPLFRLADPPSIFSTNYDPHPDGRRFVARWRGASDDVAVVLDWFADWGAGRAGR
ncbi:MAG: hypothetical protein AVDCRST_MAG54-3155, partial [uncultured Actinomycetospora sp.]